jgi:hypothetical protein
LGAICGALKEFIVDSFGGPEKSLHCSLPFFPSLGLLASFGRKLSWRKKREKGEENHLFFNLHLRIQEISKKIIPHLD